MRSILPMNHRERRRPRRRRCQWFPSAGAPGASHLRFKDSKRENSLRGTLALFLLVVAGAGAIAVNAARMREGFDEGPAGQAPAGWTTSVTGEGVSDWRVVAEAAAPSSPQVLKQSGKLPRPSFPLCLVDEPALKDGFVEVKFKTVSGEIDQAAGVVWRCKDSTNYYVCRANALEDNVVLYKVENGKRTALDIVGRKGGYGVEARVPPARWQTLRVEFAGPRFKVLLDDRALFTVEDPTFPDAGKVGLWTKADSVTLFDDFQYGP